MIKSFFHYTSWLNAHAIAHAAPENQFLKPRKRFVHLNDAVLPEDAYRGAIFGVLEPKPKAWNEIDFNTGQKILSGDILLEAHITPEDDVHVCDYSVFLKKRDSDSWQSIFEAYYASLAPIADESRWKHYDVQEVICFTPIPLARLSATQLRPRPPEPDLNFFLS